MHCFPFFEHVHHVQVDPPPAGGCKHLSPILTLWVSVATCRLDCQICSYNQLYTLMIFDDRWCQVVLYFICSRKTYWLKTQYIWMRSFLKCSIAVCPSNAGAVPGSIGWLSVWGSMIGILLSNSPDRFGISRSWIRVTPGLNKRWESFDPTRVRHVRGAVAVKILCVPVALTGCSITNPSGHPGWAFSASAFAAEDCVFFTVFQRTNSFHSFPIGFVWK